MAFRFLSADRVTDPESAEQVLAKYKNQETTMSLDGQSFDGVVLAVQSREGTLRIQFKWSQDKDQSISDIEHIQQYAKSKAGSMVRFKLGTDEFVGLLSGSTQLPKGSTLERYIDSPFVLTFAFSAQDQRPLIAGSGESGIIGVPVPSNIAEQLPLAKDLEYEPHITVCYFPKLRAEDVERILPLATEAAEAVGSFDVQIDGCHTFPTPQEDGTYPHVAKIKSQGLVDFHDLFVELCEHYYPGLVDTTFALKNYNPHLTLSYTKNPNSFSAVKALAWNVDHLTLNQGKKSHFPIPLSEGSMKEGAAEEDTEDTCFQLGDLKIPVSVLVSTPEMMKVKLKTPDQAKKFEGMEGEEVMLGSEHSAQEVEIVRLRKTAPTEFELTLRTTVSYSPEDRMASTLNYVRAVAEDRGLPSSLLNRVIAISKRLDEEEEEQDEEEPEDKEALGPGFEGTDSHIVTYVKAPQTQVIVEGPKFSRGLPLHERI